jgi:hypothetical protein
MRLPSPASGERLKVEGDVARQRVDGEPVGFARSETEGDDGGCPLGDRGTKAKGKTATPLDGG